MRPQKNFIFSHSLERLLDFPLRPPLSSNSSLRTLVGGGNMLKYGSNDVWHVNSILQNGEVFQSVKFVWAFFSRFENGGSSKPFGKTFAEDFWRRKDGYSFVIPSPISMGCFSTPFLTIWTLFLKIHKIFLADSKLFWYGNLRSAVLQARRKSSQRKKIPTNLRLVLLCWEPFGTVHFVYYVLKNVLLNSPCATLCIKHNFWCKADKKGRNFVSHFAGCLYLEKNIF